MIVGCEKSSSLARSSFITSNGISSLTVPSALGVSSDLASLRRFDVLSTTAYSLLLSYFWISGSISYCSTVLFMQNVSSIPISCSFSLGTYTGLRYPLLHSSSSFLPDCSYFRASFWTAAFTSLSRISGVINSVGYLSMLWEGNAGKSIGFGLSTQFWGVTT